MFGFSSQNRADVDPEQPKTWEDYDRLVSTGLPAPELDRIAEASANRRYADGYFDDAEAARGGHQSPSVQVYRSSAPWDYSPSSRREYAKQDVRLYPPLAQAMADKLSEHLYKRNPTRSVSSPSDPQGNVNAVIQEVYKRNGMGSVWQEVDRLTVVGGFAAIQWGGTDDPSNPVQANVWGADELVVWTDPENHRVPDAVVTLDQVDGRTRAQLWTEAKLVTYTTKRGAHPGDSSRGFERLRVENNPYRDLDGRGILPFAFSHFRPPVSTFTTDSPGANLREANKYLLHAMDETADGLRFLGRPIGVAENVADNWEPPVGVQPGEFLKLVAGQVDAAGNGPAPRLSYLTADTGWVNVAWSHLNSYIDLTLELHKIPPSAVRMILSARSGVSILAEQAPLLSWTERRRRQFEEYEREAALSCLRVISSHLRTHGRDPRLFDAVASDPQFSMVWPRLYVDLPGAERDRADGVRLQWGMASLIGLTMEREDCTEEQAFHLLENVRDQNERLRAAGIEPIPSSLQPRSNPPAGFGATAPAAPTDDAGELGQLDNYDGNGGSLGAPAEVNDQSDALTQEGG